MKWSEESKACEGIRSFANAQDDKSGNSSNGGNGNFLFNPIFYLCRFFPSKNFLLFLLRLFQILKVIGLSGKIWLRDLTPFFDG